VQWLGLILGAALAVTAVFYLIVGFVPDSAIARHMHERLELAADVRRAKGYPVNTAALYAWMLRTKPRAAVVVLFLSFWAVWFLRAAWNT
jgi:hypothetical protein